MSSEQIGDRVRLVRCDDTHTRLMPGEEGTVAFIDAFGTLHVNWDSGIRLGLVPDVDSWVTLDRLSES